MTVRVRRDQDQYAIFCMAVTSSVSLGKMINLQRIPTLATALGMVFANLTAIPSYKTDVDWPPAKWGQNTGPSRPGIDGSASTGSFGLLERAEGRKYINRVRS
jgi:hypothetical protein